MLTCLLPDISQSFNRNLLSIPIWRFDADHLKKFADRLLKKLDRGIYKKFPKTKNKLYLKHLKFMELYERAKIEEREVEGKKSIKARAPFYRTRLRNQNDRAVFERLERKR